jgi:hypothetical protein
MSKISLPTKKILQSLGVRKIVEVPIRKKGFTGRMPSGNCHSNVNYLINTIGGRRVTGYHIRKPKLPNKDGYCLFHHSVWESPEGKLVDVTYSWKSQNEILFAVIDRKEKDKITITPNLDILGTNMRNKWVLADAANNNVSDEVLTTKQLVRCIKSVDMKSHFFVYDCNSLSNVSRIDEIENAKIAA